MSSRAVQFHAAPSDLPELLGVLRQAVPGVSLHTWSAASGLRPLATASPGTDVDWLTASVGPLAHVVLLAAAGRARHDFRAPAP
ncbi:hypothetical protein [Rhizobacter sp. OV335]|uniref:hypothetical protein n=1 Tax=Rhizobacter sp. OV335 TaxID=1500264 RepID=UPI000923E350|nr:hypothetical protein [Rhizobacter sp. OV335]SHM41402.1 hypothetical protein SAMN02787076_01259 [Rhizobacter sp. OV335]